MTTDSGLFVGVRLSKMTTRTLLRFQRENDIRNPLSPDQFHVTVLFSSKPCFGFEALGNFKKPINATFKEWKIFKSQPDEDNKIKNCLVMVLDCDWLKDRHEYLMDKHDASFDFDEYIPHLTISYDAGDIDPAALPEFIENIQIKKEYEEPLDKEKKFN